MRYTFNTLLPIQFSEQLLPIVSNLIFNKNCGREVYNSIRFQNNFLYDVVETVANLQPATGIKIIRRLQFGIISNGNVTITQQRACKSDCCFHNHVCSCMLAYNAHSRQF